MSLQQRQQQCERRDAVYAQIERKMQEANKATNCNQTGAGKYSNCCALPPVAPPPLVPGCPCEPSKPPATRFCTKVGNVCEKVELTPYGKKFDCNTGKMVQNCLCVKFNGLQDSCRHPQCCTKIGCMNNPFPNCQPAQEWKNNYQRNDKQNYKC